MNKIVTLDVIFCYRYHIVATMEKKGKEARIELPLCCGHAIGEVLGSLVNMLDPDCVILSGSVAQCGDAWHDAMKRGWHEAVMPPVAQTPVVSGELGGNAPLIGAAENVVASAYRNLA